MRRKVERLVLSSAGSAEWIDYRSEQDWLAVYGRALPKDRLIQPWTTVSDARSYYEKIGRIEAATEAFEREGHTGEAVAAYQKVQVLERVLEDVLEQNLGTLEEGLTLIGRQYPTSLGPIDLLAKDPKGTFVVIELKRGKGSDPIVGQIARYMTEVRDRLGRGKESSVRGIIVGRDFDKRFDAAVKQLKRVTAYTFDLKISFEHRNS